MADEVRNTFPELRELLGDRPQAWGFFQAVRRLECAERDRPRIGTSQHAHEDPVRFGQPASLAFPPTEVAGVERQDDGPDRLLVNFLGLLGCNGPMPLRFTEFVHDRRKHHRDNTLQAFLDMFHHRFLSLFYRAWAVNQHAVSFDRGDDPFGAYIGSLAGLGMASLRDRDAVPDVAKLHYSGRLLCRTAHASGMRALLEDYFGISVSVQEFVGQWLELPAQSCCRLGEGPGTGTMGESCVVGSRVWDCQQKFRLRFGPMKLADYERMLPGAAGMAQMEAWLKAYVGLALQWEVQLVLRAEDVPKTQLGVSGRLGWTTWLSNQEPTQDADDLVLVGA